MIERMARIISLYPGRVALVFAIISCFLGFQLLHLRADFTPQAVFSKESADQDFYTSFVEEFGTDDTFFILLIQGGDVFTPRGIALLDELTLELDALSGLKNTKSLANISEIRPLGEEGFSVISFLDPPPQTLLDYQQLRERVLKDPLYHNLYISPDGKTASVITQLTDDIKKVKEMRTVVEEVEQIVSDKSAEYQDFEIMMGGVPYVRVHMVRALLRDQLLFMPACFVMIITVSYLSFRYIQGVVLPPVTVMFSVVWGLGLLHLVGGEINVLTNSLPILVMIIGVADAIHLLTRYDEEIHKGFTRREAIYHAVHHIGIACLLTSFTTACAFASLGISSNQLLSRFGIYSSLAIITAYVVTITLLPILLARWGRRVEPREEGGRSPDFLEALLDRSAGFCIRHRWPLFVAGILVVVFSLLGALRTGVSNNLFEFFREDTEIYQSNMAIEESLAGVISYAVSFQGEEGLFKDPEFLSRLSELQQALARDPLVGKTLSLADFVKEMHGAFHGGQETVSEMPLSREAVAQYLLMFSLSGDEGELDRLVNQDYSWGSIDVRCKSADSDIILDHLTEVNSLIRTVFPEPNKPFQIETTGIGVLAYKTLDDLIRDMVRSIFMASVIIFMVIILEFRSLRIGLISMIPNLIPVLLTYGAMGWLGVKLQLSTIVVFTISLGIAVDDSIHFLVRFREELRRDGDYERAIRGTFRGAGRAIVYTTVILVLGLIVLSLSSMPPTARFAYLTATTLTSALLADLFVLPACIMIFKPKL